MHPSVVGLMTQDLANQRPTFNYFKRHSLVLVQSHPVDSGPHIIFTLLLNDLWYVLRPFKYHMYCLTIRSLKFGQIFGTYSLP